MCERLDKAAGIAKAAETCANAGNVEKDVEIALDVEQLVYEVNTEEQGQIRAGIGPFLDRRAHERNTYVARQAFPTRGDKSVRVQSIRGRMAQLGLNVPSRASWLATCARNC
jgi:hypothetical protein